jgi:hypothetical protein
VNIVERYTRKQPDWGPWKLEPDRLEFIHENLKCLILRSPSGALCGYVSVPQGHPLYENEKECFSLECHGGVTFCNYGDKQKDFRPMTYQKNKLWWIGFDCAHAGDLCPVTEALLMKYDTTLYDSAYLQTYKDFDYVKDQIKNMVKQIKELY